MRLNGREASNVLGNPAIQHPPKSDGQVYYPGKETHGGTGRSSMGSDPKSHGNAGKEGKIEGRTALTSLTSTVKKTA